MAESTTAKTNGATASNNNFDLEYESMHMNNSGPLKVLDASDPSSTTDRASDGDVASLVDPSVVFEDESILVSLCETVRAMFPGGKSEAPEALDSWTSAFILINFISIGYVLNPAGTLTLQA